MGQAKAIETSGTFDPSLSSSSTWLLIDVKVMYEIISVHMHYK